MEFAGVVLVLLLILGAEFVNGWTDAPNAIATVVSTRVLSPGKAVLMATVLNLLGAMSGTAVAATIGKGIVEHESINLMTVAAAMVAIVIWSTLAWFYGLPTSESHALVAGLTGAALATAGPGALLWDGWQKVLIGLLFSTFLGFGLGFLIVVAIYWLFRRSSPGRVRNVFGRLQILSAAFMAFGHGSNDGQKFIGTFCLALLLGGAILTETVFAWPGIGRLLVQSILARDFPTVQGTVLVVGTMFILINLAVDVAYAYLDPRIRLE